MPHATTKIVLVTSCVSSRGKLLHIVEKERWETFLARTRGESDFFRSLLEVDASGSFVSYDVICAFVSQHPEHVKWESVTVQIQDNGVLTESHHYPHAACIRMVQQIDFHPHYFHWIYAQLMKQRSEAN